MVLTGVAVVIVAPRVIMRSPPTRCDGIRLTPGDPRPCDTMADSAPTTVGKNMKERPDSMEELALEAVKAS